MLLTICLFVCLFVLQISSILGKLGVEDEVKARFKREKVIMRGRGRLNLGDAITSPPSWLD